ncbi:hypothetical protein B0T17DRAFT_597073 [Bombardia bombarda]|uniref:Uncharacterized protein n=1 Tax=Bombardia bombarda TaxID=252184 RepID=A0AA40C8I1_9PEZI|nr:hypothetical protein B0T17DRAFT_597073 [Bombardia bombarda]
MGLSKGIKNATLGIGASLAAMIVGRDVIHATRPTHATQPEPKSQKPTFVFRMKTTLRDSRFPFRFSSKRTTPQAQSESSSGPLVVIPEASSPPVLSLSYRDYDESLLPATPIHFADNANEWASISEVQSLLRSATCSPPLTGSRPTSGSTVSNTTDASHSIESPSSSVDSSVTTGTSRSASLSAVSPRGSAIVSPSKSVIARPQPSKTVESSSTTTATDIIMTLHTLKNPHDLADALDKIFSSAHLLNDTSDAEELPEQVKLAHHALFTAKIEVSDQVSVSSTAIYTVPATLLPAQVEPTLHQVVLPNQVELTQPTVCPEQLETSNQSSLPKTPEPTPNAALLPEQVEPTTQHVVLPTKVDLTPQVVRPEQAEQETEMMTTSPLETEETDTVPLPTTFRNNDSSVAEQPEITPQYASDSNSGATERPSDEPLTPEEISERIVRDIRHVSSGFQNGNHISEVAPNELFSGDDLELLGDALFKNSEFLRSFPPAIRDSDLDSSSTLPEDKEIQEDDVAIKSDTEEESDYHLSSMVNILNGNEDQDNEEGKDSVAIGEEFLPITGAQLLSITNRALSGAQHQSEGAIDESDDSDADNDTSGVGRYDIYDIEDSDEEFEAIKDAELKSICDRVISEIRLPSVDAGVSSQAVDSTPVSSTGSQSYDAEEVQKPTESTNSSDAEESENERFESLSASRETDEVLPKQAQIETTVADSIRSATGSVSDLNSFDPSSEPEQAQHQNSGNYWDPTQPSDLEPLTHEDVAKVARPIHNGVCKFESVGHNGGDSVMSLHTCIVRENLELLSETLFADKDYLKRLLLFIEKMGDGQWMVVVHHLHLLMPRGRLQLLSDELFPSKETLKTFLCYCESFSYEKEMLQSSLDELAARDQAASESDGSEIDSQELPSLLDVPRENRGQEKRSGYRNFSGDSGYSDGGVEPVSDEPSSEFQSIVSEGNTEVLHSDSSAPLHSDADQYERGNAFAATADFPSPEETTKILHSDSSAPFDSDEQEGIQTAVQHSIQRAEGLVSIVSSAASSESSESEEASMDDANFEANWLATIDYGKRILADPTSTFDEIDDEDLRDDIIHTMTTRRDEFNGDWKMALNLFIHSIVGPKDNHVDYFAHSHAAEPIQGSNTDTAAPRRWRPALEPITELDDATIAKIELCRELLANPEPKWEHVTDADLRSDILITCDNSFGDLSYDDWKIAMARVLERLAPPNGGPPSQAIVPPPPASPEDQPSQSIDPVLTQTPEEPVAALKKCIEYCTAISKDAEIEFQDIGEQQLKDDLVTIQRERPEEIKGNWRMALDRLIRQLRYQFETPEEDKDLGHTAKHLRERSPFVQADEHGNDLAVGEKGKYLGVYRRYGPEREPYMGKHAVAGGSSWVEVFVPPIKVSADEPALFVTCPDGERCYIDDMAYYPGAIKWSDLSE